MKMSAPQTLKFLKLKRRLKLPHWQCVGLLEALWLFTQHNAPAGDVGRFTDEDIAAGIEWEGDPAQLIGALVECGWLDRCDSHRLLIHDWSDHAPTYLKGAMAKNGVEFAKSAPAKQGAKQPARRPAKQGAKQPQNNPEQPAPNQAKPNQTEPSQAEGNQTPSPADAGGGGSARPRDEVFDFLAAITGSDPKANGGHVAKLKKLLLSSDPPHTLAEIRTLGDPAFLARELPWLNGRKPSVGELEKHIGRIRNPSPTPDAGHQRPPPRGPRSRGEAEDAEIMFHLSGLGGGPGDAP